MWRLSRPSPGADKLHDEGVVYVVYGRSGQEGDEPIVAVVASEEDALGIEESAAQAMPGQHVRWEAVSVVGTVASVGREVHIVVQSSGEVDVVETANPVVISAYQDGADAEADLRRRSRGGTPHALGSFTVGWHRTGWAK